MSETNNSNASQDNSGCPHCQKQIVLPTGQPPEEPIPDALKMTHEEFLDARRNIKNSTTQKKLATGPLKDALKMTDDEFLEARRAVDRRSTYM